MRSNMQSHFRSQYFAFSSPEPLGLICNRPRDQETTGSGDENGYFVAKKSVTIPSTDKNSKSPSVPASSPP